MSIEYKTTHELKAADLEELFLSVEWSSGHFPEKLEAAMKGYGTVISAWDGEKLAGLLCAMDDGVMNAYIHYVLVRPDHQGRGIGRKLIELAKEKYRDYLRIVIISYNKAVGFYEQCGFKKESESSPMYITSLWT